jgi:pimeloyl-ACP methyl ester carboxylesterase
LVVGGIGEGVIERGGVDTRLAGKRTIVDALLAENPSTIAHPGAAAFRAFADRGGSDRRALAAQASMMNDTPIALEKITAPTLVLAGVDDLLARHPERLAGAIPAARWQSIPGDHLGAVPQPAFASALVDFLCE